MLGAFNCSTVIDNSGPGVRLVPKAPVVTPQQAFAFASEHEAESQKQASICQKCEAEVKRAVDRAQGATTLAQKQAMLAPVLEKAKTAIEAAAQSVAHAVASQKASRADVTSETVKVNLAGMVPNSIAAGKVFGLPIAGKGYLDAIKRDVRLAYQMPSVGGGGGYQYQWNQKQSGTTGAMSTTKIEQRQVFGSMIAGMDYSAAQGMGRRSRSRSVRGLGDYVKEDFDPLQAGKDIASTTNEILAALNEFGKIGDQLSKMFSGRWVPQCLYNADFICDDAKFAEFLNVQYPAIHGTQPTEANVVAIGKQVAATNANTKSRITAIIRDYPPPKSTLPPITNNPPPGTGGGGGTVTAGGNNMLAFAIGGAGILAFILSRK